MHTGADNLSGRAAAAFSAFREGEPSGMTRLVQEVTPLLWSVARQQGVERRTAEDVVQNTWLKLIEHAGSIEDPQGVLKWLLTTTRRDAWALSSRGRREQPGAYDDVRDLEPAETAPSPEDDVVRADESHLVREHFDDLPDRCRTLLRAIAFADKPDYAVVAEALGMPVGSIGPTRGRCLAKLRSALLADPRWEMTT